MDIATLRTALEAEANPDDIEQMVAYMKGHFEFLGVRSPAVRTVIKPLLAETKDAEAADLIDFADKLWDQPEREFQYVGCLLLRKRIKNLGSDNLADLERYIVSKSWWDTVDSLAAWSVGPLVLADRSLATVMDRWINDENLWLARTAILHQLSYKADIDADRLFHYAEVRAEDTEFFIRKAIGWALRQHARIAPEDVRTFVTANEDRLSGLTKREALKHL